MRIRKQKVAKFTVTQLWKCNNEMKLREYWSHFKAKKQGFQRRLNEILETARTYGFQFRDNWTLILLSQNKSKASDWPTNQERPFKSGTIFTSKAYSSLSFEDREYFYSFYWPQRTWAEPQVQFYSKKFHPALKWAKNLAKKKIKSYGPLKKPF